MHIQVIFKLYAFIYSCINIAAKYIYIYIHMRFNKIQKFTHWNKWLCKWKGKTFIKHVRTIFNILPSKKHINNLLCQNSFIKINALKVLIYFIFLLKSLLIKLMITHKTYFENICSKSTFYPIYKCTMVRILTTSRFNKIRLFHFFRCSRKIKEDCLPHKKRGEVHSILRHWINIKFSPFTKQISDYWKYLIMYNFLQKHGSVFLGKNLYNARNL